MDATKADSPITRYLESPKAEEDVRWALGHPARYNEGEWGMLASMPEAPLPWRDMCPWQRLQDAAHPEASPFVVKLEVQNQLWNDDLCVYFRAEGDAFIVTDNGAAIATLCLSTGNPLLSFVGIDEQIHKIAAENRVTFSASGRLWSMAYEAGLPRALCGVMLAVLQVSQLPAR